MKIKEVRTAFFLYFYVEKRLGSHVWSLISSSPGKTFGRFLLYPVVWAPVCRCMVRECACAKR